MTSSSSEPVVTPSTSSGLSPQALHDRHAARQRAMREGQDKDRRPALMRLRRLSDIQHAKQSTTLFTPEDPIVPSSGRDPACRSKPANLETSAQLKTLAPPHDLGAAPSRQQAPSGKALPRYAGQKWAPAKHSQRADAPRHLADPLSSKPVAPRKRNISEVLNLFKGKVSQAVAQRKHLKPARLDVSSGDKAMHRHRKSYEDVAKGWAAAEDMAVHTGKPHHRQHAAGCKAETLREEQPKSQNNRQDPGLQQELPHTPREDTAEVDQPARCKAPQAPRSAGPGRQHAVRGMVHTCASIAECSPVQQAAPQERQPLARMPAVPPDKYADHLKSFLLHRFAQASGLSKDQAGHPETVQQGIASLVSALECNVTKSRAGGTSSKTDIPHASTGAARAFAARSKSRQHVSAPSTLYTSKGKQQMYKTALPGASQIRPSSDLLFCRSNPASLQRRGLPQGMGTRAVPRRQQSIPQSALMGSKSVSLSPARDISEAVLPDLGAPNLGPDDCPDEWMDSIHNPGPYLDRALCEDDQDGMWCMHVSLPERLLTEDADMGETSPDAHTLASLPSSSPKLADALQQYAENSLQRELQDTDICPDAAFEQACANDTRFAPDGDSFLHMMSKGAELQLAASGRFNLQQLRVCQEARQEASGLSGRHDAWLRDPADLQDTSSDLVSELDVVFDKDGGEPEHRGEYGKLHMSSSGNSRQATCIEADPDPVAAFTDFCESLAM